MESILALLFVFAVIGFAFYYPGYLQKSRGCSPARLGRMVALGGIELVTLTVWDAPAYPIMVLLFLAVAIVVFLLNKRDTTSWWHGILMMLWQSLVFIAVVFILIDLSNALKRWQDKQ